MKIFILKSDRSSSEKAINCRFQKRNVSDFYFNMKRFKKVSILRQIITRIVFAGLPQSGTGRIAVVYFFS